MRYTLAVYGLFTTYDSWHPLVGPTLHFSLGSLGSSGPGQTWYPRNWTFGAQKRPKKIPCSMVKPHISFFAMDESTSQHVFDQAVR